MHSYSKYQQNNDDEKKEYAEAQTMKLKPLNWTKPLKKSKSNKEIFIWGKARPRNV